MDTDNMTHLAKNLQPPSTNCPFCGKPAKRGTTPYGAVTYDCDACMWGMVDSTADVEREDTMRRANERRAAEVAELEALRQVAAAAREMARTASYRKGHVWGQPCEWYEVGAGDLLNLTTSLDKLHEQLGVRQVYCQCIEKDCHAMTLQLLPLNYTEWTCPKCNKRYEMLDALDAPTPDDTLVIPRAVLESEAE